MPSTDQLRRRRGQLLDAIDGPVLLHAGGPRARNYPANTLPYRADSNFLLLFANPEPGSAAWFDPDGRRVVLFLPARTSEDALWHGPQPDFDEMRAHHGVDEVLAVERLEKSVHEMAAGRLVSSIAVPDPRATARLAAITGAELDFYDETRIGSPALVRALALLRTSKDPEEVDEMRHTARVTAEGHGAAMAGSAPGVPEQRLVGLVEGAFARSGCVSAYAPILSVRGEVLHNHAHDQTLAEGDLVLLDAGAEAVSGYCSDVTRTWPANGKFDADQARIYDVVLASQLAAIDEVREGKRYRDVHDRSCRVLVEGLVDLGLMRGDPADLVEKGAHAVFYPHGVGHLIGLDVHDLEAFGDAVLYAEGRERSTAFGTRNLRIDLDLTPGMTVTIEPGIYFVPGILRDPALRERFGADVDFARAEGWLEKNDGRGFGGIRIEDDVLCTGAGAPEVLTAAIPKERGNVESAVGSATT